MIEWIFTLLIVYLLYKLIFDFILPVSKASSQMRNKIKEMHQQQQQNTGQQKSTPGTPSRPPAEDYIDFEEIKTPNS